jgi:hypothetical protein
LWILCVTQGCKLMHLLGIPAMGALTTCLMILAYTLPFIRTVTKYLRIEQEASATGMNFILLLPIPLLPLIFSPSLCAIIR